MTTTTVSIAEQILTDTERVSAELASERVALRGFSPGDPERERRIDAAMTKQMMQSIEIQSVMGTARWHDGIRHEPEYQELRALPADLTRHRRQLKKMKR